MHQVTKYAFIILAVASLMVSVTAYASTTGTNSSGLLASIGAAVQQLSKDLTQSVAPASSSTPSGQDGAIRLELGNRSVLVTALQDALVEGGYLDTSPTGYFGTLTQAAVEKFQKAKNLPVTGYIDMAKNSLASSFSAVAPPFVPVAIGATGTRISSIQKFFITQGRLKIATSTTYFGTLTQGAVESFQESHGLPQTGIIDQATFAAMNGK